MRNKMNDIMIDIETLANSSDAVITQIGACYFDRDTGEIGRKFSVNVSTQDCLDKGLVVSEETLHFWFEHRSYPSWFKSPLL